MAPQLEPVHRLLAGEPLLRLTPALLRLARALPVAAEEWSVESTSRVAEFVRLIQERIWPESLERAEQNSRTGWPELIAGCLSAAELLKIDLPGANRIKHRTAISSARQALEPPHVYVLLRGAPPTRVFMARGEGERSHGTPEWLRSCERFALELLNDTAPPRWRLAGPAEGASQQAGLIMRCIMELDVPADVRSQVIGISGEFNAEGVLVPVAAIVEKVKRFFEQHRGGLCFVPAGNWEDLRALHPESGRSDPRSLTSARAERLSGRQWQSLIPVRSISELLVRFGISHDLSPLTRLFEQVRREAAEVSDWRGTRYRASQLVELPLRDPPHSHDRRHRRPLHAGETNLALVAVAVRDGFGGKHRGLVLSGLPGSGKSMVLHRLHWELNAGSLRLLGPSVHLHARHLRPGQPLLDAMALELKGWNGPDVRAALNGPLIAGDVWLLLDGLDELPLSARRDLLIEVQRWPGPFVLATRRLRETEEIPGTIVRVIDALDSTQRDAQLKLLGRDDLVERFKDGPTTVDYIEEVESEETPGYPRRFRGPPLPPDRALLGELSQTPLGVSLLATVLKPGELGPDSRGHLLYRGMLHLIDRAETEGRIDIRQRLLFTRLGIDVLGAAAWAMLRGGRAVLSIDDLDEALKERQVPAEQQPELHIAIEASGFVQSIGPGEWEFSHKTFAEFCAARWLERRPDQQPTLWLRLGESGVDEVIVHLCTRSKETATLIGHLLDSRDRPLTALALMSRVLLECPLGVVPEDVLLRFMERRLRLLSWLPGRDLPADVGRPHLLWQILERFAVALSPHAARFVAACHSDVSGWLGGHFSQKSEDPRFYGRGRFFDGVNELPGAEEDQLSRLEIAERLHAVLCFDVSLRALLRFDHGGPLLKARGRGPWAEALVPYLNDPDSIIREAAEDAYVETGELEKLLPWLDALPAKPLHYERPRRQLKTILNLVTTTGTPLQLKEALLRAGLASLSFAYEAPSCDEDRHRTARLGEHLQDTLGVDVPTPLSAAELLPKWRWAWESGLLGQEGEPALEELYLRFLRDSIPAARWRAIRAMQLVRREERHRSQPAGGNDSGDAEARQRADVRQRSEARSLLQDPFRSVRVEAAMFLIECGETFSPSEYLPLCASHDPYERWVGLRGAVVSGVEPSLDYLLQALAPVEAPRYTSDAAREEHLPPALTRFEEALKTHGRSAREVVLNWARQYHSGWVQRSYLYGELGTPDYGKVAEEFLEEGWSGDHKIPLEELRYLLETGGQAQRRWAVDRLGSSYRSDERSALLISLVDDRDPEIAAKALDRAERERDQARLEARRKEPVPIPHTAAIELDSAIRGFPSEFIGRRKAPEKMAEPFRLSELDLFQSFESLWAALREQPLQLESWHTVDYQGRDDRIDHIELLAEKAQINNLNLVRPVMQRLEALYHFQYRPVLLRDLGHPLLGLWAELLLRAEAPGRDLLTVIAQDERSAERVANIARGTSLQAPAVDTFIEAISRGRFAVDLSDEDYKSTRFSVPAWLSTFRDLAGLEGLIRLLQVPLGESVRRLILKYLDREREKLPTLCSEAVRNACLEWARSTAQESSSEEQVVAIHLLTLLGERRDAIIWGRFLREGQRSEDVQVAALLLIAKHGEPQHSEILRDKVKSKSIPVREAAMVALVHHGDIADVPFFLSCIEADTDADTGKPYREPWEMHPLAGLALEGVVRHGSSTDGLRVARLLIKHANWRAGDIHFAHVSQLDSTALRVTATYGRLPEHALLVLGALLHDPGDREYGVNTEGYDEVDVVESKIPQEAANAVRAVIMRTNKEAVRQAFLISTLWGGPSSIIARQKLRNLGGPRPPDVPLLLDHLRQEPDSFMALSHLASIGRIEREVIEIWKERESLWWGS